jgi:hypothetical protein
MARINKLVAVPMNDALGEIKSFIDNMQPNELSRDYSMLFAEIKDKMELMAKLEEVLVQQKCVAEMSIKLDIMRGYIYARTPFYKNGHAAKDIRVIVAKVSDEKSEAEIITLAKEKLKALMVKEIGANRELILIQNEK